MYKFHCENNEITHQPVYKKKENIFKFFYLLVNFNVEPIRGPTHAQVTFHQLFANMPGEQYQPQRRFYPVNDGCHGTLLSIVLM